eukprot:scaffold16511_cov74-Skeletonema_dohrnii-CCMP3373.AAC.2
MVSSSQVPSLAPSPVKFRVRSLLLRPVKCLLTLVPLLHLQSRQGCRRGRDLESFVTKTYLHRNQYQSGANDLERHSHIKSSPPSSSAPDARRTYYNMYCVSSMNTDVIRDNDRYASMGIQLNM